METFVFCYHLKPGPISKYFNVKEAWAIIWILAKNIEDAEKAALDCIGRNNWIAIESLKKSINPEVLCLSDKVNQMHYKKAQENGISMLMSTVPFPHLGFKN